MSKTICGCQFFSSFYLLCQPGGTNSGQEFGDMVLYNQSTPRVHFLIFYFLVQHTCHYHHCLHPWLKHGHFWELISSKHALLGTRNMSLTSIWRAYIHIQVPFTYAALSSYTNSNPNQLASILRNDVYPICASIAV